MHVSTGNQDDIDGIIAIFMSRPGSKWDTYEVDPRDTFVVARDGAGPAAWLSYRDLKGQVLYVSQLECAWGRGGPSRRGVRGVKALVSWVKNYLTTVPRRVMVTVAADNERHWEFLERIGMKRIGYVYEGGL